MPQQLLEPYIIYDRWKCDPLYLFIDNKDQNKNKKIIVLIAYVLA